MKWTTFEGKEADSDSTSHQHLSNFIWWFVGILGNPLSEYSQLVADMKRRFDNKILPYRPHPNSLPEIAHLLNAGCIHINDMGDVLIIVNKRVIGEILPPNKHSS